MSNVLQATGFHALQFGTEIGLTEIGLPFSSILIIYVCCLYGNVYPTFSLSSAIFALLLLQSYTYTTGSPTFMYMT